MRLKPGRDREHKGCEALRQRKFRERSVGLSLGDHIGIQVFIGQHREVAQLQSPTSAVTSTSFTNGGGRISRQGGQSLLSQRDKPQEKLGALSDHQRLIRHRGVAPLIYQYGDKLITPRERLAREAPFLIRGEGADAGVVPQEVDTVSSWPNDQNFTAARSSRARLAMIWTCSSLTTRVVPQASRASSHMTSVDSLVARRGRLLPSCSKGPR